jgi:hypothetical protein
MTLYELNKENMKQIKPYDPIALNYKCKETTAEIWENNKPTYWMLLCRERNDYTVFRITNNLNDFCLALVECLTNRGDVLDITKQEDGNFEIWIKDTLLDECFVYYLFDYNEAIIEV